MNIDLHCFGESGNAYKAALALELAGLDWSSVLVDFFNGETRSERWRREVNEMGEVPVMVAGDLRLTQSAVIQDWVVAETGKLGWRDEAERREILRWQMWDNHKMSSQAGATRFLKNFLPEEKRSAEVIGFMEGRVRAALSVLDSHLSGRDWIVGDRATIADLSCCSYLFYPELFGFDRASLPSIDAWLGRIEALPGWGHPYDLMPRAAA